MSRQDVLSDNEQLLPEGVRQREAELNSAEHAMFNTPEMRDFDAHLDEIARAEQAAAAPATDTIASEEITPQLSVEQLSGLAEHFATPGGSDV